ncbi:MAG TPA: hypothetical protein VLF20_04100 [Patescibacteria group bacterium]|nr:hypothetical protein [Patescibacteria group bacterium]
MVNNAVNKKSQNICFQCGSLLIFVNEERIHPEGTRFPQINIVYRCSNVVCQEKKDKEKVDRLKQQFKKAEMTKMKLEEMQEKRKQIKLAKEQQN